MSKSLFNLECSVSLSVISKRKNGFAEVLCALWELSPGSGPICNNKVKCIGGRSLLIFIASLYLPFPLLAFPGGVAQC